MLTFIVLIDELVVGRIDVNSRFYYILYYCSQCLENLRFDLAKLLLY
jgi:hypothetical protein